MEFSPVKIVIMVALTYAPIGEQPAMTPLSHLEGEDNAIADYLSAERYAYQAPAGHGPFGGLNPTTPGGPAAASGAAGTEHVPVDLTVAEEEPLEDVLGLR